MKCLVEVNTTNKINENDIIIFSNGKWNVVNKDIFLNGIFSKLEEYKELLNNKINEQATATINSLEAIATDLNKLNEKIKYILGEDDEEEPAVTEKPTVTEEPVVEEGEQENEEE